ncbi:CHASE2 domain-containing protein [Roseateles sp.]|uniref:CHASE2 domain-containing protein n=1 Tax=Roseateles sp. TaxID=1971397 RepID=UPI0039EAC50E
MKRWPWLALPAVLLLWALLSLTGAQPRIDRTLGDLLVRAAAPQPGEPASVVVDIDDASLRVLRQTLGEWPYSREVYALMLDYLGQSGARLVVIDIVLAGSREGDERLASALAAGPPVVLAAAGLRQRAAVELAPASAAEQRALARLGAAQAPGLDWDALTAPADALLDVLTGPASLGLVSVALDDDGLLRHLPLLHRVQGRSLPSLAFAARLRADGAQAWRYEPGALVAGTRRWPVDDQGRLRLRLPLAGRGGDGGPPAVSWQRLMRAALGETDDAELARLLAGRSVFVGSSAFFADEVMTPQGRRSGAALNAAVFEGLGAEPLPLLRDGGPAVRALEALLLPLGALPLLLRRQALAAGLGLAGILGAAWAAVQAGLLISPAPGLYLLALALLLTAIEHERCARERERELTRERELAEARSRAKTELLAQVSHEMRTPMNAVLGFSDILARSPLRPEQAHYVEVLGHAGRQVFALINDLLDNARIESGRLELASHPFNLVDLVELQLELMRERAQSQGLWLRVFARTEAAGWVLGDSQRVAQIVTNLVGNAIRFTRTGGVTVELSRDAGGQLLISVQDTGIGIAPDRLERIFQPFAQADAAIAREFGGTGLGLSITRSLARLMGGDVSVQSRPGEGSRFEVRLDLPDARPLHGGLTEPAEPRGERAAPSRALRLLLAEDNDVNTLVIEGMLAPLGHCITRVVDGAQALAALRDGDFDLVLMDMQMPGMDGLAATREWRAIEAAEIGKGRTHTPIVALTANAFDADVQRSLEAGCDAHLTKPISLAALLQALAKYARH